MDYIILKRRKKKKIILGYKEEVIKIAYMNHTEEIISMIPFYE